MAELHDIFNNLFLNKIKFFVVHNGIDYRIFRLDQNGNIFAIYISIDTDGKVYKYVNNLDQDYIVQYIDNVLIDQNYKIIRIEKYINENLIER